MTVQGWIIRWAVIVGVALSVRATASGLDVMPLPTHVEERSGALVIDDGFTVSLDGYREPRIERAVGRLLGTIERMTGVPMGVRERGNEGSRGRGNEGGGGNKGTRDRGNEGEIERGGGGRVGYHFSGATLTVRTEGACLARHGFGEDESYTLDVTSSGARLEAVNPLGVLRGLATFAQLVRASRVGFSVPAVRIEDEPRFPWRGLLIDVCRHWQPMSVIRRNLDGMAAVKLNVLHLHLSEDQAFRAESKRYRRLHDRGSGGKYYSQKQLRSIVAYAHDRGIRVVPEFDMPGHTTSWLVGYADLAAGRGPSGLETTWGVFDGCFDPSREGLYTFLDGFFKEMTGIFPDPFFHIGGDEVNGVAWEKDEKIQSFMREQGFSDRHDLQAYFNERVGRLLKKHRRSMVGWDEILDGKLAKTTVVQSWRGAESAAAAARAGYRVILSSGYYLDHIQPASFHYAVDPLPMGSALEPQMRGRVLGGEACMWSEYVTPETIDSRIWPRLAAVAERLWSPASVTDVDDMYRRLGRVSRHLDALGLRHRSNYVPMLERLAGRYPMDGLKTLCDVVEPVKGYGRSAARKYTTTTPLNRLVDAARPESETARRFGKLVGRVLVGSHGGGTRDRGIEGTRDRGGSGDRERPELGSVRRWLVHWRDNDARLAVVLRDSLLLHEVAPLSRDLAAVATAGLEALEFLATGERAPAEWVASRLELIERAGEPRAELTLAVLADIGKLVAAAGAMDR